MSQQPYHPPMPPGAPVPVPAGPPVPIPGTGFSAARVDVVAGTPFGLAYAALPPMISGQAVGSLVAGIASIAIALFELILGLAGAASGWGAQVAGAFAILAVVLGGAAIVLAVLARRGIRRAAGGLRGAGIGRAGLVVGIVGASIAVIAFFGSLAATLAS